jgi:hypothetical protein
MAMRTLISAIGVLATLLCGCANLKDVRNYSVNAQSVVSSFRPFLSDSVDLCKQRFLLSASLDRGFDPDSATSAAAVDCQPAADANQAIDKLASLVNDYHDALAKIAGADVANSLSDDYDNLAGALGKVRFKGSAGPPIPAERLGAVTDLAKWVSEAVLGYLQSKEIKQALKLAETMNEYADVLVVYADRNFGGYLNDQIEALTKVMKAVRERAALRTGGERVDLGENLALIEMQKQRNALIAKREAIPQFKAAVESMKAANRELQRTGGQLQGAEQLKALGSFAKNARDLYKKVATAF